jgi:hypothetical protein
MAALGEKSTAPCVRCEYRTMTNQSVSSALPAPQVRRWRRYGKDRLYVTAGDGTEVGWYDLLTWDPERVEAVRTAASQAETWLREQWPRSTSANQPPTAVRTGRSTAWSVATTRATTP